MEGKVRTRNPERTKQALLDAAATVFVQRGLSGASLDEIADVAGYTRGAVQFHFASKEELFLAVIDRRNAELLAEYADLVSTAFGDTAHVERWRTVHERDAGDVALRLELHAHVLRNPQLRHRLVEVETKAVAATVEQLLARAESDGLRWRYPVEQVAELLHIGSQAILQRATLRGSDETRTMATFLHLVQHALESE